MDLSKIQTGPNPPYDLYAVIEIPQGGEPVKYEFDKESGALMVDRFLHTAMFYPGNYGFIPHTLADDGDPMDIMVVGPTPVVPGAVIRCRPVGVLMMIDEAGADEKILAVPVDSLHPFYTGVQSWDELPRILTEQIAHFFKHYKDLEKNKKTEIAGWGTKEKAAEMILAGIERARGGADKT
ncbi:MAG: inorganic diphosphatase [Caulobacteraceae bacterium]